MAEQQDPQDPGIKLPDPIVMTKTMADIAERSQKLVSEFLQRQAQEKGDGGMDPFNIGGAFLQMTAQMMSDPGRLVQAQMALWQDYMKLWQSTTRRMLGEPAEPVATPERSDRRFKDAAWEDNQLFDFIKQSYLLTARWIQNTVRDVEGLDEQTARKVDFYTRQFVDAMAPTNFVMTNPEVLRETFETKGDNLLKGLKNLLDDLEAGKGQLRIKMVDSSAFKVGKNIAVTVVAFVFSAVLLALNAIVFQDLTVRALLFVSLAFVVFAALMSIYGNWVSIRFPKRMRFGKRMNVFWLRRLLPLAAPGPLPRPRRMPEELPARPAR